MNTGLIWFENNLRIKDNKALFEACKKHEQVIAVYCFDPRKFKKILISKNREIHS